MLLLMFCCLQISVLCVTSFKTSISVISTVLGILFSVRYYIKMPVAYFFTKKIVLWPYCPLGWDVVMVMVVLDITFKPCQYCDMLQYTSSNTPSNHFHHFKFCMLYMQFLMAWYHRSIYIQRIIFFIKKIMHLEC